MKLRIRVLAGICMMLVIVSLLLPVPAITVSANAVVLEEDDFESYAVDTSPGNWGNNATGDSHVEVKADSSTGNRFLQIYDASKKATQGVYKSFAPETNKLGLVLDLQMPVGATAGKENVLLYVNNASNRPAVALAFSPNRIVSYRTVNGVTTTQVLATSLPLNEWRQMKLEIDVTNKTFDFYLNDVLKAAAVPFRNDDVTSISTLQLTGAYYSDEANYIRIANIDNVGLYSGGLPSLPPLNENFESVEPGNVPANWTVTATGNSVVEVQESSNNRYLLLRDTSVRSTEGIIAPFPRMTDQAVIEMDIEVSGGTQGKDNILVYVLDEAQRPVISLILASTNISSVRTTSSGTTAPAIVTGLPQNENRLLTIAADFTSGSFDLYVNGILEADNIPFRYEDTTGIAKLKMTGANYNDDTAFVRQAKIDNVRVYSGVPDFPVPPEEPVGIPPANGEEIHSFDSYSSVFMSSRWYRTDGQDGQLGTLDVLKRFMATDNKWAYINDAKQISRIARLGVGFQGALNMNQGTGGRALQFDGTPVSAPWMTWGTTWGSMSDPAYYQIVLSQAKESIDAGVRSFQFDDWRGSERAYGWGGDFNLNALAGFADYLEQHVDSLQLAAWGIDDIGTFNYKTYLMNEFGMATNEDYMTGRQQSPLEPYFLSYLTETTRHFHSSLQQDLETYAGAEIEFSNNVSFIRNSSTANNYLHDLFDYGMGEHPEGSLSIDNIVANGSIATAFGKPHVISPYPQHPDQIRQGIAAAYALGQYFLVPWDIWLEGDSRYFGTVEDYGDLYHFIRQYSFLFDGKEIPATVGILLNWSDMDTAAFKELTMNLFEAGVPFRVIAANEQTPVYQLSAGQFTGLQHLIAFSPVTSFSTEDQTVINGSNVPLVQVSSLDASWLAGESAVQAAGADDIYATLRADETQDVSVIHVLNRGPIRTQDGAVTLTMKGIDLAGKITAIYRPNEAPLLLSPVSAGGDSYEVTLPSLQEWGIIYIGDEQPFAELGFQLGLPWSAIHVGNPAAIGSGTELNGGIQLSSMGMGLDVPIIGDSGSADQVAMVYKQVDASPLQSFVWQASITPESPAQDGAISGLMLRESPASNAKFMAAAIEKGAGLRLYWRDQDNGSVESQLLDASMTEGFIRLERNGEQYTVYVSVDGLDWGQPLANRTAAMKPELAALFVSSGTADTMFSAEFAEANLLLGDVQLGGSLQSIELANWPESLRVGQTAETTVTASVYTELGQVVDVDVTGEHLQWTVNDDNIARISPDGVLYGVSPGTASITVSLSVYGQTMSDTRSIVVNPKPTVLVDESFDDLDELEIPSGWSMNRPSTNGSYVKVVSLPTESDKSLAIYDNMPAGFPSATAVFEPTEEAIRVSFDVRVNLGDIPANGGGIIAYLQNASGLNGVSLLVDAAGFWYLDGTTRVTVAPVIEDKWYELELVIDPGLRTMDMYLDGQQVVSEGNFRETVTEISKLQIGGSTGGVDTTIHWNNVRVSLASAAEPEEEPVEEPEEPMQLVDTLKEQTVQFLEAYNGPYYRQVSFVLTSLLDAWDSIEQPFAKSIPLRLYRLLVEEQVGVRLSSEQADQLLLLAGQLQES